MSEELEENTESAFDQAFSEAAAEDQNNHDDNKDAETGTSTEKEEEAGEDSGHEEIDWKAKAEEERIAREQAEQRMSSWDGRLKKSSDELAKTKGQLEQERKEREQLAKRLEMLENKSQAGERKRLEEWISEYDGMEDVAHITDAVRSKLEAMDKKEEQPVTVDTDNKSTDEEEHNEQSEEDKFREAQLSAQQAHIDAIAAKHPDWADHTNAIEDWIKKLPGEQALKYARIKEGGNSEEVISLLDAYKESKIEKSKDNDDDAEAMAAVKHRSSSRRPKTAADKNDFDAAWDEAVSQ